MLEFEPQPKKQKIQEEPEVKIIGNEEVVIIKDDTQKKVAPEAATQEIDSKKKKNIQPKKGQRNRRGKYTLRRMSKEQKQERINVVSVICDFSAEEIMDLV